MKTLRIDKWLWATRFYKTRSLATKAVKLNRVQINGQYCKPSSEININDIIRLKQTPTFLEILVLSLPQQRGSATLAQHCYQQTLQNKQHREQYLHALKAQPQIQRHQQKPEKRDVRQAIKHKRQL